MSHVIGLFAGIFIVFFSATQVGESSRAFVDLLSLLIVIGGSISVSIMTNGLRDTLRIFGLFFKVFSTHSYDSLVITEQLVGIAQKRFSGTLDLRNTAGSGYHPFVNDGLRLIHNKFDAEKFQTLMGNMLAQRKAQHDKVVEKIESLAKYPPAFGMMGTIIGLVAVLKKVNSADGIESIGPSMAVALITTLYGILLSNYVLQPIADNLQSRNDRDLQVRQLIVEGMVLICQDHDPVFVREALLSLLSPDDRGRYQSRSQQAYSSEKVAA